MFYVYMLACSGNKLYVGVTKDPKRRLKEHNAGIGALYTKADSDYQIVFLEQYTSLTEARFREIQIKKWRREKKEELIKLYSNGYQTKL